MYDGDRWPQPGIINRTCITEQLKYRPEPERLNFKRKEYELENYNCNYSLHYFLNCNAIQDNDISRIITKEDSVR